MGAYSGASAAIFSAVLMVFLSCFLIVSDGQAVCKTRTPQRGGGCAGSVLCGVVLVFGGAFFCAVVEGTKHAGAQRISGHG